MSDALTPIDTLAERWRDDLVLLTAAAEAAGLRALDYFRKEPDVWWKNEGRSPVSAADLAANDILKAMLLSERPNYGWLSEETDDDSARLSAETVFVVDPIDGTRAFIAGKDVWCVSAAVVHRGRPVAGVLVAPALGEIFTAAGDGPALKNGLTVSVAAPQASDALRIAGAEPLVHGLDRRSLGAVHRVAHVPSLAYRLAMVADGRIDGTLVMPNSHDWDLAAADLILQAAGGRLSRRDGTLLAYNGADVRHGLLCAAGNDLHPALLAASVGIDLSRGMPQTPSNTVAERDGQ
ncbi:3'(2'),5'-bisphosphate nucleotidase CysQ [Rhizobium sp. TRM95111]|uniref:3'(2'),5'-bisphosphate nucleotidase CysQ n=1 Tax=Rhizobium alarense TaxID=2846851 RepID=UPI001F47AA00|nr:3'(2'),5'-bisphosphate nucleotidase CysQ [Rhizobium alarense]MCF3642287.1 3'(2'),5'-bisphosphate nucleotidase CysQ [Rhizobium alarense]